MDGDGRFGGIASRLRKAFASKGDDTTLSRFVKVPGAVRGAAWNVKTKQLAIPGTRHPAFIEGRSFFNKRGIHDPKTKPNVLVSAHSNAKIGRDVRIQGLFEGYWIYGLTLPERSTCPRTCLHWEDCYGNGMPYAKRIDHTDRAALESAIERDLERLLEPVYNPPKGRGGKPLRKGVLVRLHVLGDFFDPLYVRFWRVMLDRYDKLACYGYTARDPGTEIGDAIAKLKRLHRERFAIRWSDGGFEDDCTVSIVRPEDRPDNAFICPEQSPGFTSKGKPILCATCGLCWNTRKNVAFLEHGA